MGRIIDLSGKRFGLWTVRTLSSNQNGVLYWRCKCDCGTEKDVFGGDLKRGGSLSCGCQLSALRTKRQTTHNMSRHPIYRSWLYMRDRCQNPNNTMFHLYGGRGIRVFPAWESFEKFNNDVGKEWKPRLSLDRIDTNGNYEPGNVRWATPKEQAQNRRTNRIIQTPDGPMTVTSAADYYGIRSVTIQSRLRYGWTDPHKIIGPVKK